MKSKNIFLILGMLLFLCIQNSSAQMANEELDEIDVYSPCHQDSPEYDECFCKPSSCDSGDCTDPLSSEYPCSLDDLGCPNGETDDCGECDTDGSGCSDPNPCPSGDDCECYGVGCDDTNSDECPVGQTDVGCGCGEPAPVNGKCTDPCDRLQQQAQNQDYNNKVNILKTEANFSADKEKGFKQVRGTSADTFPDLQEGTNGHSVETGSLANVVSLSHTHLNDFPDLENGENYDVPIRMFSPRDVIAFATLIRNAGNNPNISVTEVSINMLSSTGNYTLKYTGDVNNIPNYNYLGSFDAKKLKNDFATSVGYSSGERLEKKFYRFIRDKMNLDLNNISLFKKNEDGTITKQEPEINNNGRITGTNAVPCN